MSQFKKPPIQNRREPFVSRSSTRIWNEKPSAANPYIPERCYCYGYDILELAKKRTVTETIFLLFQGTLPTPEQLELFDALLICLINPGPRHNASRAAMNAAVGKTNPAHILPIGLSILGGSHLGGTEVSLSMNFIKDNSRLNVTDIAQQSANNIDRSAMGDWHIAPGFGTNFGSIDTFQESIAVLLMNTSGSGQYLSWAHNFSQAIKSYNAGWLSTGVAAATLLDLGFHPRAGAGLYQLACSPGILAHGLELTNQPRTAMPFISDENYIIER